MVCAFQALCLVLDEAIITDAGGKVNGFMQTFTLCLQPCCFFDFYLQIVQKRFKKCWKIPVDAAKKLCYYLVR